MDAINEFESVRFGSKRQFTEDLADFNSESRQLHVKTDVKNKHLLAYLKIDALWLLGAKETDIKEFYSKLKPKYFNLYHVLAKDFTVLEELSEVHTLMIEWNTKVETLWDLTKNHKLRKLAIRDCSKIIDFGELKNAKQLESLAINGGFNKKQIVKNLDWLYNLHQLKYFNFSNVSLQEGSIREISSLKKLEELDISNQFDTEDFAFLTAKMAYTKCSLFSPFCKVNLCDEEGNMSKDIMITGKRKPFLHSATDREKINHFVEKFENLKLKHR